MKQSQLSRFIRWMAALAVPAGLAPWPVTAATSTTYTGTADVVGVPIPGIYCTNAAGQVLLKGNVHVLRVQVNEPRLVGRLQVSMDMTFQADGTALASGRAWNEVGTWDMADPAHPQFTRTDGVWDAIFQGLSQADGSCALRLTGYGVGGTIDGMREEWTITKGPGAPFDPAVPYSGTVTLTSTPVNTSEIVDNFDGFTGTLWGKGTIVENNQQLIARGSFAGVHTTSLLDSYVMGQESTTPIVVPDGMTKEWRADLVSLDQNATNAAILLVGNTQEGGYNFMKGRDFVSLNKWSPDLRISLLVCEKVALRNTNIVLALALTWAQKTNLVITTRVLDKADPNLVLYQHSVVDTPNLDPTLTTAQFQDLTGMRWLDLGPESQATPPTSFLVDLGVYQYTDGTQPAPTAIFENLELRTSEVPPLGISRAALVTWPDVGSYTVEGANTVTGPWLPITGAVVKANGLNQVAVPADGNTKFFRLR